MISATVGRDHHRLNQAMLTNRVGQFLQRHLIKFGARLIGIG